MTAKCRCIDAHTLDCYWFTPEREAYDVLAAQVVEVTLELERARAVNATLRQRLEAVNALLINWEQGADAWGTCGHEWMSLRQLRATVDQP